MPLGSSITNILRFSLLAAIVAITNVGSIDRLFLLVEQGRYGTIAFTLAIWMFALIAMVIVAVEPRWKVRLFWAVLFGFAGAVAFGYQRASGTEMTVFDGLSLWSARHQATEAQAVYTQVIAISFVLFGFTVGLFCIPAKLVKNWQRGWGVLCSITPVIPVALIAAIIFLKQGGGSLGLPKQFTELSIAGLVGAKVLLEPVVPRSEVEWQPFSQQATKKIVMLVDESLRPDYLDPANITGETPEFARLAPKFINFGPAASSGICSSYSNAMLRYGASRAELGSSINVVPTLWQYAKKAGYRTVFIDAQARNISSAGRLQNFMTIDETKSIDKIYRIDVGASEADEALLDVLSEELKSGQRVFIYANKQGVHFPYDHDYPASAARYHPTITEAGANTLQSNNASYKNAVLWNVDRFFGRMFKETDLTNTTLVYTSDHGQSLDPKSLTHCATENALPEMALVPLYVYTDDKAQREKLQRGAEKSRDHATHFQIAASVLNWMGYADSDLASRYNESLTLGTSHEPAFTTGDVFGLFSTQPKWNPIDLSANYREISSLALQN